MRAKKEKKMHVKKSPVNEKTTVASRLSTQLELGKNVCT
jgi:hypothetical protein